LVRLELHSALPRQILAAATDVAVKETLNGAYFVTFTYPRLPDDRDRYDNLIEKNLVRFPTGLSDRGVAGQFFVIKRVDEERRGMRVTKQVEAHHVAFDLNRYYLDDYVDFSANKPPSFLLAKIGNGTPYTMATVGSFDNQDVFDFGEKRKGDLMSEVAALYKGELAYDNYKITLTTRKGGNYGAEIRYRKNLAGIVRKSHDMERITRLYGYGKNGLTIEGLGGRTTKFIDSQYADPAHLFEDSADFPEIEDKSALLDAMQRYLREHELPKVSYDIDFVQLEKADPEFRAEAIREVGDTITVIDDTMGYRFDARVTEFERYPFEPKKGRVTLANFRELTAGDYIFKATAASQRAIVYTSENAVLKGVKYDDSITLVDGLGMIVSDERNVARVRLGQIGAGEYGMRVDGGYIKITGGLPNSQVAGAARWDGRTTLITDGGIYTGKIVAGQIEAETLSAITANLGHINAGSITGVTITGSMIQTRPPGQYPRTEFSSDGNLMGAYHSVGNSIEIVPNDAGAPAIKLFRNGAFMGSINTLLSRGVEMDGNYYFNGNINTSWSRIRNGSTTLENELAKRPDEGAIQQLLGYKVDWTDANSNFAVNMSFDPGTRNLKLFSGTSTLATVNIPK